MSDYPTWVVNTLTGKTEVVTGYLEFIGDTVVRVYQVLSEDPINGKQTTRTEFAASILNLDYIVRDDDEDGEEQ